MNEEKIINALDSIVWYDGHCDEIKQIINYISNCNQEYCIPYPEFLPQDPDTFLRVIWSICVVMYGDYGTSPRYGWLEQRRKQQVLQFLTAICKTSEEAEGAK